jgi:hypothetical protein
VTPKEIACRYTDPITCENCAAQAGEPCRNVERSPYGAMLPFHNCRISDASMMTPQRPVSTSEQQLVTEAIEDGVDEVL